jgi:Rieske 2Fe-2S family protein
MNTPLDLAALTANRRPGYTLPAAFYASQEVYEQDLRLIFGRHWIFVGAEPEIPEAGDFITVDIGTDSIIILRDDDEQLRAFHNVCRHRGARLQSARNGVLSNIVCPYHQWTYNLGGELTRCKHMGEGFDRRDFGLKPVHVRSLAGLLFICLSAKPAPGFDEMQAAMEPYLKPHDLLHTKVAHQTELIEHGNWKLTMENNRECYHCTANHPELLVPLLEFGFGYQASAENAQALRNFDDLLAREHVRWEGYGLASRELDLLERVTGFRTLRLPIARAGESQTPDTKVASTRLLGALPRADLGGLSFWTQPNSWHHFMSDHIITFSVLPLAPDRTMLRTTWLVHKDAQEGVDYDLQRLTSVWIATNHQDGALVARAQTGVESPAYQPGPYSPFTEGLVEKIVEWYIGRLGEGLAQDAS